MGLAGHVAAAGVGVPAITGLTAMLVLPWVGKFLWAPLVDAVRPRRWGYRAWIIPAQIGMATTLLPLIWLEPVADFRWWAGLLLLHAFCAATQDVAIDAMAINLVPADHRGRLNGCMQAGMLLGRSVFGGGALLMASVWGRQAVIGGLIACITLTLLVLLFTREPVGSGVRNPAREFRTHFAGMFRSRTTWLGLGFALTAAAAFEATGNWRVPCWSIAAPPRRLSGCFSA